MFPIFFLKYPLPGGSAASRAGPRSRRCSCISARSIFKLYRQTIILSTQYLHSIYTISTRYLQTCNSARYGPATQRLCTRWYRCSQHWQQMTEIWTVIIAGTGNSAAPSWPGIPGCRDSWSCRGCSGRWCGCRSRPGCPQRTCSV